MWVHLCSEAKVKACVVKLPGKRLGHIRRLRPWQLGAVLPAWASGADSGEEEPPPAAPEGPAEEPGRDAAVAALEEAARAAGFPELGRGAAPAAPPGAGG
eukprot:4536649-Lingulodinium_polyedra.AAC.1